MFMVHESAISMDFPIAGKLSISIPSVESGPIGSTLIESFLKADVDEV